VPALFNLLFTLVIIHLLIQITFTLTSHPNHDDTNSTDFSFHTISYIIHTITVHYTPLFILHLFDSHVDDIFSHHPQYINNFILHNSWRTVEQGHTDSNVYNTRQNKKQSISALNFLFLIYTCACGNAVEYDAVCTLLRVNLCSIISACTQLIDKNK